MWVETRMRQCAGMSPDEARVRDVCRTPVVLFHVSPAVNRESILSHGLDVSRMGLLPGSQGASPSGTPAFHITLPSTFGRRGSTDFYWSS